MTELICIPHDRIEQALPMVQHFITAAMSRADLGKSADVIADVVAGRALLWIAWDKPNTIGAGVTCVHETERSKVCTIVAWGSDDMEATLPLLATIEDYASGEGCDCVRLFGRKGWMRMLDGYHETKTVLERRL